MPDNTGVAALLEDTAARIEVNGWTRNMTGPQAGPNCLGGGLEWECVRQHLVWGDTRRMYAPLAQAAFSALDAEAWRRGAASFVTWNDSHCKDLAEATDFIRTTAKKILEAPSE